jgi:acetyl esterase/lipase
LPAAHADAVRALQFIRSKAEEWGIDKDRIAAYGGSAGAQLVAYLAWGDDYADPKSDDPIARESSRLAAVAPSGCQSTMDLDWWEDNIPGYTKAYHNNKSHIENITIVDFRAVVEEISVINRISSDDPPTFLSYGMKPDDPIPSDPRRARGWSIHHVKFGIVMLEKLQQAGVEAYLKYPGEEILFDDDVEFLIHQVTK